MTDLHVPAHPVRFVTAASLFDGHDAAINIMRRILQRQGAEVIHLGHNRSVDEVVTAALQEDAQGIAISSYQGGHVEYFKYMVDLLRERGGGHIKVFGGGGGVIVPREIELLHALRRRAHLLPRGRPAPGPAGHDQRDDPGVRRRPRRAAPGVARRPLRGRHGHAGPHHHARRGRARCPPTSTAPPRRTVPVLGITGTGGAASPRSPTSWCAASASTRTTSCASPCSRSTRRGARAAARCSATASA